MRHSRRLMVCLLAVCAVLLGGLAFDVPSLHRLVAPVASHASPLTDDALQMEYYRKIDALVQGRAGTPLAPLLGGDAAIAQLPHGTPAALPAERAGP